MRKRKMELHGLLDAIGLLPIILRTCIFHTLAANNLETRIITRHFPFVERLQKLKESAPADDIAQDLAAIDREFSLILMKAE